MKRSRIVLQFALGGLFGGVIVLLILGYAARIQFGLTSLETISRIFRSNPSSWVVLFVPALSAYLTRTALVWLNQIINRGQFFEAIFQNSPIAIVSLDDDHRIVATNPAFQQLFGYEAKEMVGRKLDDMVARGEANKQAKGLTKQVLAGEKIAATVKRHRKDGSLVDVEVYGVPVIVEGKQIGAVALYHDLTARIRAEAALRESEQKYRDIYENVSDYLYAHDLAGNLTNANPAFVEKIGYDLDTLLSMNVADLMPKEHRRFFPYYLSKVTSQGRSNGLLHVVTHDGDTIIVEYRNSIIEGVDGPIGVRGSARDITKQKMLETQLKTKMGELDILARTDSLTNLYNRRGIYEHLEAEARRAERLNQPLSIALVDVDQLKYINDEFGHLQGDWALQMVAQTLDQCKRKYDRVGRYGGDEFLIVFPGAQAEDTTAICKRIRDRVREIESPGEDFRYSVSIGLASFNMKSGKLTPLETVLARADDALYEAKSIGGGCVLSSEPTASRA